MSQRSGWKRIELGEALERIVGGGTPSRGRPEYWAGRIPWASVKDVSAGQDVLEDTEEHISEEGLRNSAANLIDQGIPIICTRMAVGKSVVPSQPIAINQDLKALYPKEWLSPDYLRLALRLLEPRLAAVSVGSTVKGIRLDQLVKAILEVPPFTEQRRIAEILDTVDRAIRHTEAIIVKLEQAKAGLLHDLLTRGLDENGELRDPKRHPEQFQDSEVGLVPRHWQVVRMRQVVPETTYGISSPLSYDPGVPVLRMNNLSNGEVNVEDLKCSNSTAAQELLLEPGDVLFNRTNSMEHVGRTAIWRGQLSPVSFASYLVRLEPDRTRLLPEYLNLWLNLPETQVRIRAFATPGVQQVNINPTNLRKTFISVPPLNQQWKAIDALEDLDARIALERGTSAKLTDLKTGMMQDMLTGRVRVPVAEATTA